MTLIKISFLAIVFNLFALFNINGQESSNTITVKISGMKSDIGDVYVALYNNSDDFLKNEIKGIVGKVKSMKSEVVFKNVPNGIYAISLFHDVNQNKKMDTNFIGIPNEPVGISNGATGSFGPPKFKDAKFSVSENKFISVVVK